MPKRKLKENKKSKKTHSKNVGRILLYILLGLLFLYLLYFLFVVFSIKSKDITEEFNTKKDILSERADELKKTLIIIEEGGGDKKKITDVYVYFENSDKKAEILIYIFPQHFTMQVWKRSLAMRYLSLHLGMLEIS